MNKIRSVVFAISCSFLILVMTSFAPHKFYVSKTTVEYNQRTQQFEVTCKFFTDDLEKVLENGSENSIHLGAANESSNAGQLIENYVQSHLKLTFDDQTVLLKSVGMEVESDLTYCYFEFFRTPQFHALKVENSFMVDVFSDQQNLLDFKMDASTSTLLFSKNKLVDVLYK